MPKDEMTIRGRVTIVARDVTGKNPPVILRTNNLVTTVGKNVVRDLLLGTGRAPQAIAVGTGTTAATEGDTALENEVFRGEITRRKTGNSAGDAVFYLLLGTNDANGYTLTEIGLFDSPVSGGGNLIARAANFGSLAKTSAIEATVYWEIGQT